MAATGNKTLAWVVDQIPLLPPPSSSTIFSHFLHFILSLTPFTLIFPLISSDIYILSFSHCTIPTFESMVTLFHSTQHNMRSKSSIGAFVAASFLGQSFAQAPEYG